MTRWTSRSSAARFDVSDKIEWEAIFKTKAVRVAYGKEAQEIRKKYPDRILASRMVRRRKPLAGINERKAKSRWCVAGHSDPDTERLLHEVFAYSLHGGDGGFPAHRAGLWSCVQLRGCSQCLLPNRSPETSSSTTLRATHGGP